MMKLSLGSALLAAVALTASACGSSHPTASPPTNSSSRFIVGGAVRCTATVRTPVQAGHELGVTFRFHNVSKHAVDVPIAWGGMWVRVKSSDGTTYDTKVPYEGANFARSGPITVAAGKTATEHLGHLRVRWPGPLSITPGCGVPPARPIRVAVTSPGLPPTPRAAVADVVAATNHLLDHCRPRASGVSVVGRIDPPSGDAPPLQARCSIELRRDGNFFAAQVLAVTPPGLHGASVRGPYEHLSPTWRAGARRNAQVLAWEFVVTRKGAVSVASAQTAETRLGGWAPDWIWESPYGQNPGGSACGYTGGSSGSEFGPDVSFISACGR